MDLIGKAVVGALVVEEADIVFRCYWYVARKKKRQSSKNPTTKSEAHLSAPPEKMSPEEGFARRN